VGDKDAADNKAADDAADAKNAADAAKASKDLADKTAADEAEAKKNADSDAKAKADAEAKEAAEKAKYDADTKASDDKLAADRAQEDAATAKSLKDEEDKRNAEAAAMNAKNDAATAAADKAVADNSAQEDKDIADEVPMRTIDIATDEADVECKEDPETFQPIECKIKEAGKLKCVPITGQWKSADDDGMCSTKKDLSEDFDAMNHQEDKEIGQNSAEGKAWDDTVYTKDASKSQVIGDAEAAKGHAEDAAQQKAVADNRAAGYTGASWGKSE